MVKDYLYFDNLRQILSGKGMIRGSGRRKGMGMAGLSGVCGECGQLYQRYAFYCGYEALGRMDFITALIVRSLRMRSGSKRRCGWRGWISRAIR